MNTSRPDADDSIVTRRKSPTASLGLTRGLFCVICLTCLFAGASLAAAPTQEEVFKSISQNVSDSPTDLGKYLPFCLLGVAVVLLLAVYSQRRERKERPKSLNHQGKLLKEITRNISLRSSEVKQLKQLAEDADPGKPAVSPLTLLLCPSVLARSIQNRQARRGRIDRKIVLNLAKRVGLQATTKK